MAKCYSKVCQMVGEKNVFKKNIGSFYLIEDIHIHKIFESTLELSLEGGGGEDKSWEANCTPSHPCSYVSGLSEVSVVGIIEITNNNRVDNEV